MKKFFTNLAAHLYNNTPFIRLNTGSFNYSSRKIVLIKLNIVDFDLIIIAIGKK